jgi:hypothetical protein
VQDRARPVGRDLLRRARQREMASGCGPAPSECAHEPRSARLAGGQATDHWSLACTHGGSVREAFSAFEASGGEP